MKTKQSNLISKKFLLSVLIILIVSLVTYLFFYILPDRGMVKVDGYKHFDSSGGPVVTCLAQSPECGYCPGEVINNQCYVDPNDNTQNYILK